MSAITIENAVAALQYLSSGFLSARVDADAVTKKMVQGVSPVALWYSVPEVIMDIQQLFHQIQHWTGVNGSPPDPETESPHAGLKSDETGGGSEQDTRETVYFLATRVAWYLLLHARAISGVHGIHAGSCGNLIAWVVLHVYASLLRSEWEEGERAGATGAASGVIPVWTKPPSPPLAPLHDVDEKTPSSHTCEPHAAGRIHLTAEAVAAHLLNALELCSAPSASASPPSVFAAKVMRLASFCFPSAEARTNPDERHERAQYSPLNPMVQENAAWEEGGNEWSPSYLSRAMMAYNGGGARCRLHGDSRTGRHHHNETQIAEESGRGSVEHWGEPHPFSRFFATHVIPLLDGSAERMSTAPKTDSVTSSGTPLICCGDFNDRANPHQHQKQHPGCRSSWCLTRQLSLVASAFPHARLSLGRAAGKAVAAAVSMTGSRWHTLSLWLKQRTLEQKADADADDRALYVTHSDHRRPCRESLHDEISGAGSERRGEDGIEEADLMHVMDDRGSGSQREGSTEWTEELWRGAVEEALTCAEGMVRVIPWLVEKPERPSWSLLPEAPLEDFGDDGMRGAAAAATGSNNPHLAHFGTWNAWSAAFSRTHRGYRYSLAHPARHMVVFPGLVIGAVVSSGEWTPARDQPSRRRHDNATSTLPPPPPADRLLPPRTLLVTPPSAQRDVSLTDALLHEFRIQTHGNVAGVEANSASASKASRACFYCGACRQRCDRPRWYDASPAHTAEEEESKGREEEEEDVFVVPPSAMIRADAVLLMESLPSLLTASKTSLWESALEEEDEGAEEGDFNTSGLMGLLRWIEEAQRAKDTAEVLRDDKHHGPPPLFPVRGSRIPDGGNEVDQETDASCMNSNPSSSPPCQSPTSPSFLVLLLVQSGVPKESWEAMMSWGNRTRTIMVVSQLGEAAMAELAAQTHSIPNFACTPLRGLRVAARSWPWCPSSLGTGSPWESSFLYPARSAGESEKGCGNTPGVQVRVLLYALDTAEGEIAGFIERHERFAVVVHVETNQKTRSDAFHASSSSSSSPATPLVPSSQILDTASVFAPPQPTLQPAKHGAGGGGSDEGDKVMGAAAAEEKSKTPPHQKARPPSSTRIQQNSMWFSRTSSDSDSDSESESASVSAGGGSDGPHRLRPVRAIPLTLHPIAPREEAGGADLSRGTIHVDANKECLGCDAAYPTLREVERGGRGQTDCRTGDISPCFLPAPTPSLSESSIASTDLLPPLPIPPDIICTILVTAATPGQLQECLHHLEHARRHATLTHVLPPPLWNQAVPWGGKHRRSSSSVFDTVLERLEGLGRSRPRPSGDPDPRTISHQSPSPPESREDGKQIQRGKADQLAAQDDDGNGANGVHHQASSPSGSCMTTSRSSSSSSNAPPPCTCVPPPPLPSVFTEEALARRVHDALLSYRRHCDENDEDDEGESDGVKKALGTPDTHTHTITTGRSLKRVMFPLWELRSAFVTIANCLDDLCRTVVLYSSDGDRSKDTLHPPPPHLRSWHFSPLME